MFEDNSSSLVVWGHDMSVLLLILGDTQSTRIYYLIEDILSVSRHI